MLFNYRDRQFQIYNKIRLALVQSPDLLVNLEKFIASQLVQVLRENLSAIIRDYNEASYLYSFWRNYPPDDRGRASKGDQFPWIEVGEHAVGTRLSSVLSEEFQIRDAGLPSGADQRFLITSSRIAELTNGITDSAWLFADIKSVGPRDDAEHVVMSHNQVSGNGVWETPESGVLNKPILAKQGKRASHDFHCSLAPLYVLSDETVAPTITVAIKPIYEMIEPVDGVRNNGQPLSALKVVSIPNGLLLSEGPKYLERFPGLFFPGKDDKSKNPKKLRARVSFARLIEISPWRVQEISVS